MANYNNIGIDVGTAHFVSAKLKDKKSASGIIFSLQKNAFLKVDNAEHTKGSLEQAKVDYVHDKNTNSFYIVGEDANDYAQNLGQDLNRPMRNGAISAREQYAIPIIKEILKNVLSSSLPSPREISNFVKTGKAIRKIVYSSPGQAIDDPNIDVFYHSNVLYEIFKSLGYEPIEINEAQAIIFSELEDTNYTGIAISFGAGMINVCVAFNATKLPSLTFSIAKSGDWIDEKSAIAGNTEIIVAQMAKEDKSFNLNIDYESGVEKAICIYYNMLIKNHLLPALVHGFSNSSFSPKKPIKIILSGGTASVKGFIDVVKKYIPESFKNKFGKDAIIGNISVAKEPLYSVAAGCLAKAVIS